MALAMVRKPEIPSHEMEALRHLLGRTWRRGSWPLADECVDVVGEAAAEEDGRSSAPAGPEGVTRIRARAAYGRNVGGEQLGADA